MAAPKAQANQQPQQLYRGVVKQVRILNYTLRDLK